MLQPQTYVGRTPFGVTRSAIGDLLPRASTEGFAFNQYLVLRQHQTPRHFPTFERGVGRVDLL